MSKGRRLGTKGRSTSKGIVKKSHQEKYGLGQVLLFGKKVRPNSVIIMLHGLGDNAKGCAGDWAGAWAAGVPGSLVVVPESSDLAVFDEDKDLQKAGRDWLRQSGKQNVDDPEATIQEIQRVTRRRLRQMNAWLTDLLRKHHLKNRDVVLCGFSAGCIPACCLGARRRVKAVVLVGGVGYDWIFSAEKNDYLNGCIWPRWEELMPKSVPGTKFLAVNGTKDRGVPRKRLEALLADCRTTYRWEKGLLHQDLFHKRFRGTLLKWMQGIFGCH